MTKSFTNTLVVLPDSGIPSSRKTELGVTNGLAGISIGMRYTHEIGGVLAVMTPDEARNLAADLTERANEIDAMAARREAAM